MKDPKVEDGVIAPVLVTSTLEGKCVIVNPRGARWR